MKTDKKDTSPYVYQRNKKLTVDLNVFDLPWTERQKELIQVLQDKKTQIVMCKGPAGTAKTIIAVYAGLMALKHSRASDLYYIRVPVESSTHNLGFIPGEANDKMMPYLQPLLDKLNELLPKDQIKALQKDDRLHGLPVGYLRGLSFNTSYIIFDEAQNANIHDILLAMTRLGKFSKLIMVGDTRQSDIKNSGFQQSYSLFDTQEAKDKGIVTFSFGTQDIVRNELLAYIIEKFEAYKGSNLV